MLQDISEVEAAARVLRSAAFDSAGALKFTGFGEVAQTWPGLVAHEYQRFLDELELGNCVGALWQLCDCSELLCKFSALVMILDLRAHAPNEAEVFLDRLFDDRPLSLGGWVSLTIDVSKTVVSIAGRAALFAPEVGAFFAKAARSEGGKATQTELGKWFSRLVAFRNQTRGHGAYGTELAADAEVLIATASALETLLRGGALVWPTAIVLRVDSLGSNESLMGAGPIRKRREEHDSETHLQETVNLALVRAERTLSLSPLIALRRCRQCEKQDIFCFDSVDRSSPRPRFFLLDYLAGHRLTLPHFADPSLQVLAERPPKQLAQAAEAQLSEDFSETQLKSLLLATDIESRRIPPSYLLDLSTSFLSVHERGILLIEGPSQIGKSVAMTALEEQLRHDPSVAVVRFAAKKELQYTATQLDLAVTAGFREQFGRDEKDQSALLSLTRLLERGGKPEDAFIAYLRELDVSPLKPSAIEKLVLIIDGLDELRNPRAAV
ncbi:MAG TPA: hypothetical protein VHM25_27630, partial [Polyangiaceae bacterium]|nr:hypothetical protein [Polyangiaceae bacterium]